MITNRLLRRGNFTYSYLSVRRMKIDLPQHPAGVRKKHP